MTTREKLLTMVDDLDLDEDDLELLDADGINGIFDDDLQAEDAKAAHAKAQATAVLFAQTAKGSQMIKDPALAQLNAQLQSKGNLQSPNKESGSMDCKDESLDDMIN